MSQNKPTYEINTSLEPSSCLPTALNREGLIDITSVGDSWRKYLDTSTNKIHDGAEYYKKLLISIV